MDWIKSHIEKVLLAITALALLGVSALLAMKAKSFNIEIPQALSKSDKVPTLVTGEIEARTKQIGEPASWSGSKKGSLFVSTKYLVKDGALIDPREGTIQLHPPVPNAWFEDSGLDLLNNDILSEDTDQDGFTNRDEWIGDGTEQAPKSTDPQKKELHPSYVTKLRLVRAVKIPFRLILRAWEGEEAKPETLQFQINTLDVKQPTQFVKIGEMITGTKFKMMSFKQKMVIDSNGVEKDVSELTLENQENKASVALVVDVIANSPESYAQFRNLWAKKEFAVKKDGEFTIEPDQETKYKLIDIQDNKALIGAVQTGQKLDIPLVDSVSK